MEEESANGGSRRVILVYIYLNDAGHLALTIVTHFAYLRIARLSLCDFCCIATSEGTHLGLREPIRRLSDERGWTRNHGVTHLDE